MIGTSTEILLWLTKNSHIAPLLGMSRQRLVGLRKHLYCNELCEDRKEEILLRLKNRIKKIPENEAFSKIAFLKLLGNIVDIRCLRKRYLLPAVVRDHHGKFYNELTMVRMVSKEEKMKDLHLEHVCGTMTRGNMPSEEVVREILRRKGWTMFEPRHELPSVWEVECE